MINNNFLKENDMNLRKNLFIGLEAVSIISARKNVECLKLCHEGESAKEALEEAVSEHRKIKDLIENIKELIDDPIIDISSEALFHDKEKIPSNKRVFRELFKRALAGFVGDGHKSADLERVYGRVNDQYDRCGHHTLTRPIFIDLVRCATGHTIKDNVIIFNWNLS